MHRRGRESWNLFISNPALTAGTVAVRHGRMVDVVLALSLGLVTVTSSSRLRLHYSQQAGSEGGVGAAPQRR